jgi:hypothetical protein
MVNEHSDGVCLTFERGRAREFDLVVGADGLHSNVRGLVFAYEARVRGFVTGKQSSAAKLISVFATQTQMGIRLRNLVMRAMNFDPLGDLLVGRSLRDTFVLPDYRM